MNTTIKTILFLSPGLAITVLFVFNTFSTVPGAPHFSPASQSVTMTVPYPGKSLDRPTSPSIGTRSIQAADNIRDLQITDRNLGPVNIQNLAEHGFEQLSDVIWQAVKTGNDDYSDFQLFAPLTPGFRQHESAGEILAELIRIAPTSDMQVDALRLLAEASQEFWMSPSGLGPNDSNTENPPHTMSFFDESTVGGFLDAVAEVVENGNQRERLAALSTLEEMHQFAPIWEVAYSVLNDPDPQIRMRALELLTYGDLQVATDHLLTALSDPNPDISELAEKLLIGLAEAPS